MKEIKPPVSPEITGTPVDLGDDLLGEDSFVPQNDPSDFKGSSSARLTKSNDVDEWLQNAKILLNEGLIQDAKKLIHQVLIHHPDHLIAKSQLAEIQNTELRSLMDQDEIKRPSWADQGRQSQGIESQDPEALLKKLDEDLQLGIFSNSQSAHELNQIDLIYEDVERELSSASFQDWIDMGVAFLEMELYSIAARLFTAAGKRIDPTDPDAENQIITTTSLTALVLILEGKPYEAFTNIQPILRDLDIPKENKVELLYLMGRAYEILNQHDLAREFYGQVYKTDQKYRDIERRLRKKPNSRV